MIDLLRWFLVGVACGGMTLTSVPAHGQPKVGHDPLAIQLPLFPVGDFVERVPKGGFLGGHLDWTFGTSLRPVERVLAAVEGKSVWRVHLFNGPGLRNGQLGRYEPHFGLTKEEFNRVWEQGGGGLIAHLHSRAVAYCELFGRFPQWSLEISPTLEHNLSSRAFRQQARAVRDACPAAVVVDNPVGGVRSTKGFKVERHGAKVRGLKAPCNVSLDGDSATDINVRAWLRRNRACQRFVWDQVYNCRIPKGFVDPRQRTACPTRSQLRELFTYTDPVTPAAPKIEGCTAVESPRLWKPWGETFEQPDVRSRKPLWLSPTQAKAVLVLTALKGMEVASLRFYGPFEAGGFRYYSGTGTNLTPGEMADKAVSLSGSPYVVVREGRQCFGPLHPAFRGGFYR